MSGPARALRLPGVSNELQGDWQSLGNSGIYMHAGIKDCSNKFVMYIKGLLDRSALQGQAQSKCISKPPAYTPTRTR